MNINPLNFSIINNKNSKQKNVSDIKPKGLASDTFVKSNISFGSSYGLGFFFNILGSLGALSNLLRHEKNERQLEAIMEALNDKRVKTYIQQNKSVKMEKFLLSVGINDDYTNKLFFDSGIRTLAQFDSFSRIYNNKPYDTNKTFKGQFIEAVEIYGHLKYKEDLSKFSEILLYIYNEETDSENPDFSKLNSATEFLKNSGLNSFKDFDKNFSHIKYKFNNFEDISDKADAIDYLQNTYDDKIDQIRGILSQNPIYKSKKPQQIYSSLNDITDYLYDKNNNDLSALGDILDYALQANKIKPASLKLAASHFNNFEHPGDKIDFYLFLKDWDISINDFNCLCTKGIIEEPDIVLHKLVNKKTVTQSICNTREINDKEAFEIYKNFADILNAIYNEQEENTEEINEFLNIAQRFNIKNSTSFLSFYNKAANVKKASLTSEEVKEFIDLLKYSNSDNLFKEAQDNNTSVVKLLLKEKEIFKTVEKDIENFIISEETNYFALKTALEIYKDFRSEIIKNPKNISNLLQDILDFDILSAQQYSQKTNNIAEFSKFFTNKQDMLKFFAINNINFDETQKDNEYIQNCIEIFRAVYDKNDLKKSQERINYLAKSGFLVKSKPLLNEFLEKLSDNSQRRNILSLIADKKIPSLTMMEKFFKQYSRSKDSDKKLLEYLSNPNLKVDFVTNMEILNSVQKKIDRLHVPIKLNCDNIIRIDTKKLKSNSKISNSQIIPILDSLKDQDKEENFLREMPNNTLNNTQKFTTFRIAQELATKIEKSGESYKNITKLLKLSKEDLKLPGNCSHYIYARAIEQALPDEFIDFINSTDWINYSTDKEKTPSIVLHARLRAIDRFALNDASDIQTLYSEETKEKLRNLFKTIYTTSPTDIKESVDDQRIVVDFEHNSNIIEAVFSDKGDMITVVPKRNS